jgi:hypothetical protein
MTIKFPPLIRCDRDHCNALVEPHVRRCGSCRGRFGPATTGRAGIAPNLTTPHRPARTAAPVTERAGTEGTANTPGGYPRPRSHRGPVRAALRGSRDAGIAGFPGGAAVVA